MPFTIIRNDLTRMEVDAIVNAANTALQMGGGVCGAIFRAAGASALQAACEPLAPIQTGEAVITPGFGLPAKYIIHTAGPVYIDGRHGEERLLGACYANALKLATQNGCESVAFPLISSGIYGYPKAEALRVATAAIQDFLADPDHDLEVFLVVFDKAAFAVSEKLLGRVKAYIDENYVDDSDDLQYRSLITSTEELVIVLDEPFARMLLRLSDSRGKTDVEVYKRANLDRRLFSKIRSNHGYTPSKRTVLAIAVALELNLEETDELLERAGYALSHSQKFDVIVEYFIANGRYDIFEINDVLFQYDQPLLGGSS